MFRAGAAEINGSIAALPVEGVSPKIRMVPPEEVNFFDLERFFWCERGRPPASLLLGKSSITASPAGNRRKLAKARLRVGEAF